MNTKRYETLEQIKEAVLAGHTVHWKSDAYTVSHDGMRWLVLHPAGATGLYWADGVRTDFKATDFYTKESK